MSSTITARDTIPAIRRDKVRLRLRRALLAVAALAIAGAGAAWYGYDWWTTGRFIETTDDAYVGGNVTPIAPHVSGFVAQVLVTDNQLVKAGQLLIRLDRPRLSRRPRPCRGGRGGTRRGAGRPARAVRVAAIHHPPAGSRPRGESRAGELRRDRCRPLSQPGADQRRLAPGRAAHRRAGRAGARRRGRRRRRAGGCQTATQGARGADRRGRRRRGAGAVRSARPPGSTSATPRSARRSTAMSATAPPQVGAYVTAGTYLVSVIPATGCGWTPISRRTSSPACARARPRPWWPTCCPAMTFHGHRRQPRARHRRRVQRHPAGERHRQLHQDRAARAGAHRCWTAATRALRMLRPGLSTTVSVDTRRAERAVIAVAPQAAPSVLPFVVMCVGMFIALLDIQIVASSLAGYRRRAVGGAGRDQLGADRLSDRRDRHDPAVRLADAGVLHALAVHHLRGRLHRWPACCAAWPGTSTA